MESVNVSSAEARRNAFSSKNVIPLIKSKAPEDTVLASSRRFYCLTSKTLTDVRILDRLQGTKVDLTFPEPVQQIIVGSTENTFAVFGGAIMWILSPRNAPDGSLTTQNVSFDAEEPVKAIAPGTNGSVVLLTVSGKLVVVSPEGTKAQSVTLKESAGKASVLAFHRTQSLAITPGKGSALDVVSLTTEKSVLTKAWVPHGEDVPTTAMFFQQRNEAGARFILTAANNNNEIRFWSMAEDNSFTLIQQVTLGCEDEGVTELPPRIFSAGPSEDFFILGSKTTPSLVVVELDRNAFKAFRATDWKTDKPLLNVASIVRKSGDSKSLDISQCAVVRTSDATSLYVFDNERLCGSKNLGVGAAEPSAAAETSVTKWFSGAATEAATPPAAVATSVSSSKGRIPVTNSLDAQYVTTQAVAALRTQTATFREALSTLDNHVVDLQRNASGAMKSLQEPKSRDEAQETGRAFAQRNKHRLASAASTNLPSNHMTPQQAEMIQSVRNFTHMLPTTTKNAALEACKGQLVAQLPSAVARAMVAADAAEQEGPLPKITVTEGMQHFHLAVDKLHQSQNRLLKQEIQTAESASIRLMASLDRPAKTIAASKAYLAAIKNEMAGLRQDVAQAGEAMKSARAAVTLRTVAGPSTDKVLEEALKLAAAGKWSESVVRVLELGDAMALMQFLQTDDIKAKKEVLVSSQTLRLPVVIQVLVTLSHDIRSHIGNAAFRVSWINDFLVEWDDTLTTMQEADAKSLAPYLSQLENVLDSLKEVDPKKDVDRSTKNKMSLITKIISALV